MYTDLKLGETKFLRKREQQLLLYYRLISFTHLAQASTGTVCHSLALQQQLVRLGAPQTKNNIIINKNN